MVSSLALLARFTFLRQPSVLHAAVRQTRVGSRIMQMMPLRV